MTEPNEKSRPLAGAAVSETNQPGRRLESIVAEALSAVTVGMSAETYFTNCHAVLVFGKVARRRLYFSLHSAERAVERARARGDRADMVLVQLVPVQHLAIVPTRGGDDD